MHAIEYLLAINSHYYCLLPFINSKVRHESVILTVYCHFDTVNYVMNLLMLI